MVNHVITWWRLVTPFLQCEGLQNYNLDFNFENALRTLTFALSL